MSEKTYERYTFPNDFCWKCEWGRVEMCNVRTFFLTMLPSTRLLTPAFNKCNPCKPWIQQLVHHRMRLKTQKPDSPITPNRNGEHYVAQIISIRWKSKPQKYTKDEDEDTTNSNALSPNNTEIDELTVADGLNCIRCQLLLKAPHHSQLTPNKVVILKPFAVQTESSFNTINLLVSECNIYSLLPVFIVKTSTKSIRYSNY